MGEEQYFPGGEPKPQHLKVHLIRDIRERDKNDDMWTAGSRFTDTGIVSQEDFTDDTGSYVATIIQGSICRGCPLFERQCSPGVVRDNTTHVHIINTLSLSTLATFKNDLIPFEKERNILKTNLSTPDGCILPERTVQLFEAGKGINTYLAAKRLRSGKS